VPDIIDAINLKGAAFCIEHEYFEFAEEMLSELSPTCLASPCAAALQQRIRDTQIAFWQTRYRFALIVSARFPNYLSGHLYADLCILARKAAVLDTLPCSERSNEATVEARRRRRDGEG
jgi:hypothetical protein